MSDVKLSGITDNLPEEIEGWKKSDVLKFFGPDNLFKYINGSAELYISYDFINLVACTYKKKDYPEIKIDIFDMGTSSNAYGVFQHGMEEVDRFVAPEIDSEYAGGLLTFWKGKYYISILAFPETDEKRDVVKKLGQQIVKLIEGKSKKPSIIGLLPEENLVKESIRYFRHHVWLNTHYFISSDNVLKIDKNTEAVLAKYDLDNGGKKRTVLLLVKYPDQRTASAAYNSFLKSYMPDHKKGFKKMESERWTGCILKDRKVIIVLNASDKQCAKVLLEKINKKI